MIQHAHHEEHLNQNLNEFNDKLFFFCFEYSSILLTEIILLINLLVEPFNCSFNCSYCEGKSHTFTLNSVKENVLDAFQTNESSRKGNHYLNLFHPAFTILLAYIIPISPKPIKPISKVFFSSSEVVIVKDIAAYSNLIFFMIKL